MRAEKMKAPRLAATPLRQFTRAQLAGRYVQLLEVRGAEAIVAFPNGLKTTVPKADLKEVETFTTCGSGG